MKKLIAVLCMTLFLGLGVSIPSLAEEVSIIGDKAIATIWSGISTSDVKNFWNDIQVLKSKGITKLDVWINSPGGDAFQGLALADEIQAAQDQGLVITAYASGIVASAAVPIFAVCSFRYAKPSTIFMVHEAALWKWPGRETQSDIASQGKMMELLQRTYLNLLVSRSNLSFEEWQLLEAKTSWFGAKEALKYGLIDGIK
jgi:ATP-dependent Clp protease protease subunit